MPGHFRAELLTTCTNRSRHAAIRHRGRSCTYSDLERRSRIVAARLQQAGIEPGDRVALCLPEKDRFVTAHLGTLIAGAVTLPLNPGLTGPELAYYLKDSGARIVVVGAEQQPVLEGLRGELPHLREIIPGTAIDCDGPAACREPDVGAGDPCLIVYSSGTTGWPKGIVHSHANVSAALRSLQESWRFTADDAVVNVLPLFHVHGLCFAAQLTLLAGGCVHLEDRFDPAVTLDAIGRGTVFMAVPTIWYRLLEQPEFRAAARTWKSARLFTCGSAPIRPEVLPQLETILDRPIINRYGMTEAFVITSLPLDGGPWLRGSVGVPLSGIEIQLVGEAGSPVPVGTIGAVRIRGPNLFRAYWGQPEATRAAFADGWFDTGDLGQVDAAGFLTLVGRKHDLIITNGFNVYPQVVERVANECPGVAECAVVGVPDDRRGERVVAVVVRSDPELSEATFRAYLDERLVEYQRPREIHFVEALPRNALGKVLRRELRERKWGGERG
jgi:malonyl-CoA/methylmalonyl-CoA synthetase